MIHPSYLGSLAGDIRERYKKKIARIQIDPYQLPAEAFSDDRTKWREASYVDVVHILIFQESAYTKDQLKNYKSLDAYKLFQDGWMKEILHKEINGVHLLRAKVTHSMRVSEKPLEPWVIVCTDGSVEQHIAHAWQDSGNVVLTSQQLCLPWRQVQEYARKPQ